MTKLGDLFLIPEWSAADRDVVAKALNRLESIAHDLGAHIGPEGVVSDLKAGAIRINAAGMKAFSTGLETIRLDADGDAFFGSNLSAPATTSFVIFSNAQTYNSESMGAADVLLGDNSSGKANLLWDKSAGKILFRGGTTEQGSIDTTGTALFGAGTVRLDAEGITMRPAIGTPTNETSVKWISSGATYGSPLTISAGEAADQSSASIFFIAGSDAEEAGQIYPDTNMEFAAVAFASPNDMSAMLDLYALVPPDDPHEIMRVSAIASSPSSSASALRAFVKFSATDAYSWISLDSNYSIGCTAGELFRLSSNHLIDTAAHSVMEVQGRTAPVYVVFNEDSRDMDFRIESNTYANMFIVDAGADQVQVGTATAGAIATLDNSGIIFNEDSQDRDFRVESNGDANALFVDGGTDRVGIGTNAPAFKLHVTSPTATESYLMIETTAASAAATGPGFFASQNDGAAIASGHQLGAFGFVAHDGVAARATGSALVGWADGLWSGSDHRASLAFYTVPASSVTVTEALRIQNDQTLKLSSANSWTANGTGTVTISNLAPAGVGTATISKWLTVTDNAGGVLYIPAWT